MLLQRMSWLVMTSLCVLVAAVASRYLQLDPSNFFEEQRDVFIRRESVLLLHIIGGMTALLLGPWQFVSGLRKRWPLVHRVIGRGYVLGVAAAATGGLLLAATAYGGVVSSLGFASLALIWAGSTLRAIREIRSGDVVAHRRWMGISFSLALAAVSLRLLVGVYAGLDSAGLAPVSFGVAYAAIAWLCWVPNLLISSWWTRSSNVERSVIASIAA